MSTRSKDDNTFSASEMAKRGAEKELDGYERAFAVRDRLVSNAREQAEQVADQHRVDE